MREVRVPAVMIAEDRARLEKFATSYLFSGSSFFARATAAASCCSGIFRRPRDTDLTKPITNTAASANPTTAVPMFSPVRADPHEQ